VEDLSRYFSPKVLYEDDKKLPAVEPGADITSPTAIADHAIKVPQGARGEIRRPAFFQYIAFNAPHFPLQALPEDIARYSATYHAGWNVTQQARYRKMLDLGLVHNPLPAMERESRAALCLYPMRWEARARRVNRPLPWMELTDQQRDFQAAKDSIHAAIDRSHGSREFAA